MASVSFAGVSPTLNVGNMGLNMDNQGASRLQGALLGSSKIQSGDLPFFIPQAVNPAITNVLSVIDQGTQVHLRRSMVDAMFYNASKGVLISLVSPIIRTDAIRVTYTVDSPIIHPAQLTTLGTVGQINAAESFTIATDARMIGTTLHSALDTVLKSPDRLYTEAYKSGMSMLLTFNQLVIMHYMVNGIISLYFIKGAWHHNQEVRSDYLFATNKLFQGLANDSMDRFLETVNKFRADLAYATNRSQTYLLAPMREAMHIAKASITQDVKEYILYLGVTGFNGEVILPDFAPSTRSVTVSPDAPMWNVTQLSGVILAVVPASRLSRGINLGNLLETTEANTEFYYHPQREAWGNPKHYPNQYELGFYDMPFDRQFYMSMTRRLSFAGILDVTGNGYHSDYIKHIKHLNDKKNKWTPSVNDPTKRDIMRTALLAPDGIIQNVPDYKGEPVFTAWNKTTGQLDLAKNLFGISQFTCPNSAVMMECRRLAAEKAPALEGVMELVDLIKAYVVNIVDRAVVDADLDFTTFDPTDLAKFDREAFLSLPALIQSGVSNITGGNAKAEAILKAATRIIEQTAKVASAIYSDPLFSISPLFNRVPRWMPQEQSLSASVKLISTLIANFTDFEPLVIKKAGAKNLSERLDLTSLKGLFVHPAMLNNTAQMKSLLDGLSKTNSTLKDTDLLVLGYHALASGDKGPHWNPVETLKNPPPATPPLSQVAKGLRLQSNLSDQEIEAAVHLYLLAALVTPEGKGFNIQHIKEEEAKIKGNVGYANISPRNALVLYLQNQLQTSNFVTEANTAFTTIVVSPTQKIPKTSPLDFARETSYPPRAKSQGISGSKSGAASNSDESEELESILPKQRKPGSDTPLIEKTGAPHSRRPPGADATYTHPTHRLLAPGTSDFWQDKNWTAAAWDRDSELYKYYAAEMNSTIGIVVYAYLSLPVTFAALSSLTERGIWIPCDFFVVRPQVNRYASTMLVADGAMRAFVHPTVVASEFDEIRNIFTSTTKARIGMVQLTFPNNFTFRGAFLKNNEYGLSSGVVIDTVTWTFQKAVKSQGLGINEPSVFVLAIPTTETLYQGFSWTGEPVSTDYLTLSGLGNVQLAHDAFSMLSYYQKRIPDFGEEIEKSRNKLVSTVKSFTTTNPSKTSIVSPVKMLNNIAFTERFSCVLLAGPTCQRHDNRVSRRNGVSPHGLAKHQVEGTRETWIGKRVEWYDAQTTPAIRSFAQDQN